jgi:WD40 repeat protein
VTALAFSADGKELAVGLYGRVLFYDTVTWQKSGEMDGVVESVRAISYASDGTIVAGSGLPGRSGCLTFWSRKVGKCIKKASVGGDSIESVAWMTGDAVLMGCGDKKAYFSGFKLEDHNDRVTAVAVSPKGGDLFATGGMDKMVKVWKADTRKAIVNFDQSEAGITGLAFLPNGSTIAGSSLDGRLYWWNVAYDTEKKEYVGRRVRTSDAHAGGVNAISISANGQRLITGGDDRQVRVWEAASGRSLKTFTEPRGPIYAVALSPDGKTAAAAGREGKVYVWSVDDGRLAAVVAPAGLAEVTKVGTVARRSAAR